MIVFEQIEGGTMTTVKQQDRRQQELREWLVHQMQMRHWKQQDIINASKNCPYGKITSSSISNFLSGKGAAGEDLCRRLAWIFGASQAEVFRIAGILTEELEGKEQMSPITKVIVDQIADLPEDKQIGLAKIIHDVVRLFSSR